MVNVFEGARRIAILASVLVTAGTVWLALSSDPYISLNYTVKWPNAQPNKTSTDCPYDAAKHYFSKAVRSGTIGVSMCLLAADFGTERLIPYKFDEKGMMWGAAPYSDDVRAYERSLEERFVFSSADAALAESELKEKYWDEVKQAFTYLAVGLAIFWAAVWAVGWTMRGFLGIPYGKDRREPNGTSQPIRQSSERDQ